VRHLRAHVLYPAGTCRTRSCTKHASSAACHIPSSFNSRSTAPIVVSSHTQRARNMACTLFVLLLGILVFQVQAHPLSFLHKFSATSQEGGWLWGWVWGAESFVSVPDRSPPLTFHSRPADFGLELQESLLGYVIPMSSFTTPCATNNTTPEGHHSNSGCPKLCINGPRRPDLGESWIALVQRGHCSFVDKVSMLV